LFSLLGEKVPVRCTGAHHQKNALGSGYGKQLGRKILKGPKSRWQGHPYTVHSKYLGRLFHEIIISFKT